MEKWAIRGRLLFCTTSKTGNAVGGQRAETAFSGERGGVVSF